MAALSRSVLRRLAYQQGGFGRELWRAVATQAEVQRQGMPADNHDSGQRVREAIAAMREAVGE